jgi:hypothetical protein
MGLKCSPDIAQAAMKNVLSDIEDADIYIDDVGAFSNHWDHHVKLIATILRRLVKMALSLTYLSVNGPIRSAKQDDIYGASNIVLPCPSS